ncbi:MAG: DUF1292 domain-containing protein [Candidatus Cloacimonetes bacterium]|nr:DUF1292 domain-containing protein [Candidatus Cloacimonadota bacterium]
MTKKDNCINTDEHVHDCNCEGEDCSCEDHCEAETNIITLDMEDGSQKDFEVLQIINHEGKNYVALAEPDSDTYDVLRFEEVDDALELSIVDDDEEYKAVTEIFNDIFSSEEFDMDMDEEEKE